mmetsp:Transcript_14720/g.22465  ORF Transcript_14720/g.22465 Transcript_14720/m.22465 type:complete len:111 (-) Transcript_14720:913-1245(-)
MRGIYKICSCDGYQDQIFWKIEAKLMYHSFENNYCMPQQSHSGATTVKEGVSPRSCVKFPSRKEQISAGIVPVNLVPRKSNLSKSDKFPNSNGTVPDIHRLFGISNNFNF